MEAHQFRPSPVKALWSTRVSPMMQLAFLVITLAGSAGAAAAADYTPKLYKIESNVTNTGLGAYSAQEVTLTSTSKVVTLDYGNEVAGWPFVEVKDLDGPVQIELKYSEPFSGLNEPQGDGPWYEPLSWHYEKPPVCYTNAETRGFVNGLMNSFRVETFNITKPGRIESFLLQGGQRWQSIELLKGSSVKLSKIGMKPSVEISPDPATASHSLIPGAFSASSDIYGKVWGLGARVVQAACFSKGSQPSTWEITKDGAYIRGQFPAVSAKGSGPEFDKYTLEFDTKVTQGGTGWRMAGGANNGYGAYFVLTSSDAELETTAITPLDRNALTVGFGFSIINQQILPSSPTVTTSVSVPIHNDHWYHIKTAIDDTNYTISVNGTVVATIGHGQFEPYNNPGWGSGSVTQGSFGFGPFLNQAAYFKNVKVTSTSNGKLLYSNALTSTDILGEYRVASNEYSVCLDGAKRDRVVWIGDYAHTSRIIAATTGRFDILKGMIDMQFAWQIKSGDGVGLTPMQPFLGASPEFASVYYPSQYAETDYHFFFMLVLGDYLAETGDMATLKRYWYDIKLLVSTLVKTYLDNDTNLMAGGNWFTAQGQDHATAPNALFVTALKGLVNVATAVGDQTTVDSWTQLSTTITDAINSKLWNDQLGAYSFSIGSNSTSAILATAFAIRGGVADSDKATKSIARLPDSFLKIGYKDNSAASDAPSTQLSPNTQGFLLEALFEANLKYNVSAENIVPSIRNLAETFWPKMVTDNAFYTGTSWEYLFQDGSPGIGLFTSLAHPWGAAPTYIYTNYILGVRTEWDSASKSYRWIVDPAYEVAAGLGITWASGKVPLPGGGYIQMYWSTSKCKKRTGAKADGPGHVVKVDVIGNSNVKVHVKQRN